MPAFHIITFSLLLLLPASLSAGNPQEEYLDEDIRVATFDRKKWGELKKDLDYSTPIEKQKKPAAKPRQLPETDDVFNFLTFLKFFFLTAGIVALVWFLLKMAGNGNLFAPGDKKLSPAISEVDLEEIEKNLENTDLDHPIRKAISDGNYPLAIRLYFLALLKALSGKKMIRWEKDKTNGEYLRELAGSPVFEQVQEATRIFERIWYGKKAVTREDFVKLESIFANAIQRIEKS